MSAMLVAVERPTNLSMTLDKLWYTWEYVYMYVLDLQPLISYQCTGKNGF